MTVSTDASCSRARDVRSRKSDSGVVMRMSAPRRAKRARACRCVARAHGDRRDGARHLPVAGDGGDAGERRLQVAFDVGGERLERRDVDDAASGAAGRRCEEQPVEAPQEGGQRLAAARRREQQRGLAAGDGRPPALLGGRGRREHRGEPLADDRVEQVRGHRAAHRQ
jgi:hypothetical protein